MAAPTPYTREYNFSNYQAANPSDPLPAPHVDAELNRVKLTTDETIANLALLQNGDGTLKPVVDYDQLTGALLADIGDIEGSDARIVALEEAMPLKAPLASPVFTGNVTGSTLISTAFNAAGSGNSLSNVALSMFAANVVDTDGTLAANSDTRLATQKAVKTYADQLIAAQDAMVFKGVVDCSANPNYPAADRGWSYRVSVAGKIGGASGVNVETGDLLLCLTDGTASGDQATVGANWAIIQTNLDGAVIGPTSAVDGVPPLYDGTSGRLIKSAGSLSAWRTAVGLGIGAAVQAWSTVLDAFVALSPTDDDFLQRKAGAWVNRTPTQATADLIAFVGDSGSGGAKGLVPAPIAGDATKFLRGDGQFANPTGAGGDVSGPASSTDAAVVGFDGTTGKLIKQLTAAQIRTAGGVALTQIGPKQTVAAGGVAAVVFTDIPSSGYSKFILHGINVASETAATSETLAIHVSTDNGSTFKTTSGDYYSGVTAATLLAGPAVTASTSTFKVGSFTVELMGLGNAARATSGVTIWSSRGHSATDITNVILSTASIRTRSVVEADNAFRCVTASGADIAEGSIFILYGVTET